MKFRQWFLMICSVATLALSFASPSLAAQRLKLATTTSTENSGLLYALLPPFEEKFGVRVDVIAVGTGKALKLGENGDVDVVLVHAPKAEEEFVRQGYGINRREVMYNDFVIVGPQEDPAGIRGLEDAVSAFTKIYRTQSSFASRGDDSGTHAKEKAIWEAARKKPWGNWYLETGQGMGPTLQIADEKRAYCLTDRGTFLAYQGKVDLVILCQGDPRLYNLYGITAVSPARHPHVNYLYAMALIGWVTSPEGQRIIATYQKFDQPLFHPLAIPEDTLR